jgi:hypothetical protein
MTHTTDCVAAFAQYNTALAEYETAWPDACDACGGRGGLASSYDPSPAGVALSPGCMWDWEPCPACIDRGACPRCRQMAWPDGADNPCPSCGWDSKAPGRPEPPECWCDMLAPVGE